MVEQPFDQRRVRHHVGHGHRVGRPDLDIGLQTHVVEEHGHGVLHLGARHGALGVYLAEGALGVAPLLLTARYEDSRRVQKVLGIAAQVETRVHHAGHQAAAVGVAEPPDLGPHQLVGARRALEHRRVVADEREQRHERERQPQLPQAVRRRPVVYRHLGRRAAPHHARPERPLLAQVQVHELVAPLGDELQVERLGGGVVAHRERALAVRRQRVVQRALEPLERRPRVLEARERARRELNLRRRLDGHGLAGPRHAQEVALRVARRAGELGFQLAQQPFHAVGPAVRHGAHVVVHEGVLQLDAQLAGCPGRRDAALEIGYDGVDVACACRLVAGGFRFPGGCDGCAGNGCFIHVAGSCKALVRARLRYFVYNTLLVAALVGKMASIRFSTRGRGCAWTLISQKEQRSCCYSTSLRRTPPTGSHPCSPPSRTRSS